MRERGVELWLVGLNPGCWRWCSARRSAETLGRERMLFNLEAAVERYRARPTSTSAGRVAPA